MNSRREFLKGGIATTIGASSVASLAEPLSIGTTASEKQRDTVIFVYDKLSATSHELRRRIQNLGSVAVAYDGDFSRAWIESIQPALGASEIKVAGLTPAFHAAAIGELATPYGFRLAEVRSRPPSSMEQSLQRSLTPYLDLLGPELLLVDADVYWELSFAGGRFRV